MTTMDMHLELTDDQAYALAQFVKRVGWQEWRQNAVDDDEAALMREAFGQLARQQRQRGFGRHHQGRAHVAQLLAVPAQ